MFLIDEKIEPTQDIIAHLLSLRDAPGDDIQEGADIVPTPEIHEEPEYPSESESEVVEWMGTHPSALQGIPISRQYDQH